MAESGAKTGIKIKPLNFIFSPTCVPFSLLLLHNKLSDQTVDNCKDRREENHADQTKEGTPNQGCSKGEESWETDGLADHARIDDVPLNQLHKLKDCDRKKGFPRAVGEDKDSTQSTSRERPYVGNEREYSSQNPCQGRIRQACQRVGNKD